MDIWSGSGLPVGDMHPVEVGRAERGTRDLRVSTVVKLAPRLEVPACDLLKGL